MVAVRFQNKAIFFKAYSFWLPPEFVVCIRFCCAYKAGTLRIEQASLDLGHRASLEFPTKFVSR